MMAQCTHLLIRWYQSHCSVWRCFQLLNSS